MEDKRVRSVPLDEDGDGRDDTVIEQQNVGPGVERGSGEFPDPHMPPQSPAAPGSLTLTDAVEDFEREGFDGQFMPAENGRVKCLTCGNESDADELGVQETHRVEGASDPADMAEIAAVECPHCGTRGTLVLKYGPSASEEETRILQLLAGSAS